MTSVIEKCTVCPRKCGVLREQYSDVGFKRGFCDMPSDAVVVRAALHHYEEPCISGSRGSGTVFFAGCNLRCAFCQNRTISRKFDKLSNNDYKLVDANGLKRIFHSLIEQGAHNINLVTPSHYAHIVAEALDDKLPVPVVYNSGGYDSVETLEMLRGKVDIFMPDMKYSSDVLARDLSCASDYTAVNRDAILKMYSLVGKPKFDDDGMMRSGLIIRHLILPGQLSNTEGVIDWLYDNLPKSSYIFSLMGQYTPPSDESVLADVIGKYPELKRPISADEYDQAKAMLEKRRISSGYLQQLESVGEDYVPLFGSKYVCD